MVLSPLVRDQKPKPLERNMSGRMLSKISQSDKDECHMISLLGGI